MRAVEQQAHVRGGGAHGDLSVRFNPDLVRKYDRQGPRYTSYPTAVQFHGGFTAEDYGRVALETNRDPCPAPLSLYVHVPFCDTVCYYCACNKIITRNRAHAGPYLERLYREVERQASLFDAGRSVQQLHWGGGTPTFLDQGQMRELMGVLRANFPFAAAGGEHSIEIDPRTVDASTMELLAGLGFNRVSFGVQDFDERVQRAVNRIQSEAQTRAAVDAARRFAMASVSVDLIYGLPYQSVASFSVTLDKLIALGPDRVSVFNYAHLPHLFKVQRQIAEDTLPAPEEKLAILGLTIDKLTGAGYLYIGMDHFARPDDELAVAQREGTLSRNFQGYSTHAECDLIGLGVSAISKIGGCYAQNARALEDYERLIDQGGLAVVRGVELSADDWIRREVIRQLACRGWVDVRVIEDAYGIDFSSYFARELEALRAMAGDGLVRVSERAIEVLPAGRLLLRNICMVFDAYLQGEAPRGTFSRVI